jgi:hypothetical protein
MQRLQRSIGGPERDWPGSPWASKDPRGALVNHIVRSIRRAADEHRVDSPRADNRGEPWSEPWTRSGRRFRISHRLETVVSMRCCQPWFRLGSSLLSAERLNDRPGAPSTVQRPTTSRGQQTSLLIWRKRSNNGTGLNTQPWRGLGYALRATLRPGQCLGVGRLARWSPGFGIAIVSPANGRTALGRVNATRDESISPLARARNTGRG